MMHTMSAYKLPPGPSHVPQRPHTQWSVLSKLSRGTTASPARVPPMGELNALSMCGLTHGIRSTTVVHHKYTRKKKRHKATYEKVALPSDPERSNNPVQILARVAPRMSHGSNGALAHFHQTLMPQTLLQSPGWRSISGKKCR